MRITALVENTTEHPDLKAVHGLSLYIETGGRKIMFDVGLGDTFEHNAAVLGVDLRQVELLVISHGHGDHGGGLARFLEINPSARVYVRETGFAPYFSMAAEQAMPIGLDPALKHHPQVTLTGEKYVIDDNLTLFSGVTERAFFPNGNRTLYKEQDGTLVPDTFTHEQNLIIREGDNNVLIAGCAHNGVVNILRKAQNVCGCEIKAVIGGFHLMNPTTGERESQEVLQGISTALGEVQCYTCHCTGGDNYRYLKGLRPESTHYLSAGDRIEL